MNSPIELPFIYWNKHAAKIAHSITAIAASGSLIATGASTGDICIWRDRSVPQVICVLSQETECRVLAFATPPHPRLLDSSQWILSVHADNLLRTWDSKDGRCFAVSDRSVLPEATNLSLLVSINSTLAAVGGELSTVIVVDVWRMERVSVLTLQASLVQIVSDVAFSRLLALDESGLFRMWEDLEVVTDTARLSAVVSSEVNDAPVGCALAGRTLAILTQQTLRVYQIPDVHRNLEECIVHCFAHRL